ncbi:hypothetical protein [Longibaculum muris]|uniref:hypothetical protein n=1 Tax=Longibaculum muris TaxID=1796628 RepID=UPI0022E0B338|nr:hypothetical protein [Longibaculum muris]
MIKELTSFMKNENNKQIKNNIQIKLNNIRESNFKLQYIGRTYYIETLYNKLKFNEFLKISKIDSKNIKTVNETIKEHIKDKSNFKDIIDIAFWEIIFLSVFTPIINYIQPFYIPVSSSELDTIALSIYLVSVTILIFMAIFINNMIHRINDSKNKSEKRLYISLYDKLNNYNFDINDLKKYIE